MKKFTIIAILVIATSSIFAQEKENQEYLRKNEVKINMSNLIGFKWLDVGYERVLNEESTIGVNTLFSLDDEIDGLDEYRTFSITPYYRHFFSNKYDNKILTNKLVNYFDKFAFFIEYISLNSITKGVFNFVYKE